MKLYVFTDNYDHSEDGFYHPAMVISNTYLDAINIFCSNKYEVHLLKWDTNSHILITKCLGGVNQGIKSEYKIFEYEIENNSYILDQWQ
jgi:hypothetical protein